MLHDSSLHERYNSGVHPVTLLTEQRRKIVLNALTDIGYVTEDRKTSQSKLADYIESKINPTIDTEKGNFTPKLTPLPTPVHGTRSHKHSGAYNHDSAGSVQHDQYRRFQPKWDHYDTMRARWGYIQPQVRLMKRDDDLIAPRSSHKYVKVDGHKTVVHGNVNDIHRFETIHERKLAKQNSVSSKSELIETIRLEKLNTYYIPSPCVRY